MAFLTFGFLLAFPEDLDDWFDDDAFLGIFFGLAIGLAGLFKLTYSFIWTYILLLFIFRKNSVAAFNPLFAIAQVLMKKLSILEGFKVIFSQMIGYFLGVFIVFLFSKGVGDASLKEVVSLEPMFNLLLLGFGGGLFLTYVFLQMKNKPPTEKGDYLFLIVPIAYIIVLSSLSLSNPALAVGLGLPSVMFTATPVSFFFKALILQIGPIIGSIVASILFGLMNDMEVAKVAELKEDLDAGEEVRD